MSHDAALAPASAATPAANAPRRALVSWVLFDWAAQPFFINASAMPGTSVGAGSTTTALISIAGALPFAMR